MNILYPEESLSLSEALLRADKTPFFRVRLNHSIDILSWIQQYEQTPFVYWSSRNKKEEWGGIGLAEAHYSSVLSTQKRLKNLNTSIKAFGGMSFSRKSNGWGEFGHQTFWIPNICIYRQGSSYFFESIQLEEKQTKKPAVSSLGSQRYIPSQKNWGEIIHKTYEEFQQNRLRKIVLARQSKLEVNIHPLQALKKLKEQQSSSFDFAFCPHGTSTFIGCSPERLFSLKQNKLKTEALAGTRSRETDPSELLESEKDQREHLYVREHILKQLQPL